jgi:hypothetical protein
MARIRTIKPEFWQNPQVCRCTYAARLLFIGTWNHADDHGNLPRDAEKLQMQVFPHPVDRGLNIENLIVELITQGLLMEYSSEDEQRYLHVLTFEKHQFINRPSKAQYPQPDKTLIEQYMRGVNAMLKKAERESHAHSQTAEKTHTHAPLHEHSLQEGKGRERSKPKSDMSLRTYVEPALDLANGSSDSVVKIFDYWRERMKSPRSALSDKRKRLITAALKLHSPADLCKAIRGCSKDPWHMGMNDSGRPFNSIELILRDEKHIEQFIAFDTKPPMPVRNDGPLSLQQRRRRTAEAFGFVPAEHDDSVIDMPPGDDHVVSTKH